MSNWLVCSREQDYGYIETLFEAEQKALEYAKRDNVPVQVCTSLRRVVREYLPTSRPHHLFCGLCNYLAFYSEKAGAFLCEKCGSSFVGNEWIPAKGRKTKPAEPRNMFKTRQKIFLLVEENPKRPGTKAHERFKLYKDGITVEEFLRDGGTREDLQWDTQRKFIEIR